VRSRGQQPGVEARPKAVRLHQTPALVACALQAIDLEDRANIERVVVVERELETKRVIEGHGAGFVVGPSRSRSILASVAPSAATATVASVASLAQANLCHSPTTRHARRVAFCGSLTST
jgi:hypothetical protein